jgi:hypothetical protein
LAIDLVTLNNKSLKRFLLFFSQICVVMIVNGQTYWRIDPQNEWTGTDTNWNNLQQSNAVITAGNFTQPNLIKSDGGSSSVSFVCLSGFKYNSSTAMQGSGTGVFSDLVENHGWYFSNGAQFKFTGLNNSKYYTVYILVASWHYEGGTASFSAGDRTSTITSTALNVGDRASFPNWENDPSLNSMINIAPKSGSIALTMYLTGYGAIEAIILKEQAAFWVPTNPTAPTNQITNDDANTFDFTYNPSYSSSSLYNYTLDSGWTWHALRTKPLVVNNVSIKKGYVGVRVKDMNGNGAGLPLWSDKDYTITSPTISPSVITMKIVLSGKPEWTTKLVAASLKYNKYGRYGMTMDDRGLTVRELAAYITGGKSPTNGQTYAGKTFTDGANVNGHTIKWTGSIASNAYNNDTLTDASNTGYGLTFKQMNPLIVQGWNLLDHSAFHGLAGATPTALGFNNFMDAAQNRNYHFRKLAELGTQYVMRYGVVPTNDPNYHSAWEQLGYPGGSSQGTHDGYPHTYNAHNVTNWIKDRSYKVHLRYFSDLTSNHAFTDWNQWYSSVNDLVSVSNAKNHFSTEIGMHTVEIDSVIKMMNYAATQFGDNIWVCGLQEFMEYFETAQLSNIKQRINGDTLIVTIDQSFLNDEIRWRDMSFLLSSNKTISSVTVIGADDYSYNTTTGLINVYKKKNTGYSTPPNAWGTGFAFNSRIPLKTYDVYMDNNYDRLPEEMIDGDTATRYSPKVTGSFIYTPYDFVVDLQDWGAIVKQVKIRVNAGGVYTTKVLLTRNDNETEDSIGVFSNQATNKWLTFSLKDSTQKYVASRVILRTDNPSEGFGNEIRVFGDYMPYGVEQKFTQRKTPLKYELGANLHWWSLTNNVTGQDVATVFEKLDTLKLYSVRNYGDTWDYQNEDGSLWSFNPVQQGWREEQMEQHLKSIVPEMKYFSVMHGQPRSVVSSWDKQDSSQMMKAVVTELKSLGYGYNVKARVYWTSGFGTVGRDKVQGRAWVNPLSGTGIKKMSDSWQVIPRPDQLPFVLTWGIPNGHGYKVGDTLLFTTRRASTLPITYTGNLSRQNPTTWDTLAKLAYGWGSRKGKNPKATLMPVTGGNVPLVATNTSDWLEQMNEPDKSWVGYDDYMNGADLAAAWSKGYDNNKVFSTILGLKNADTAMKYSSSGLAVNASYPMRGEDYWSKVHRGNRPKTDVGVQPMTWKARTFGWVDHPYDIIQFHNYSYTGGSNQYAGNIQSGLPLELSGAIISLKDFNLFRNKYAPYASNDVGEWGYDRSQYSTMNAPNIDNHHADEVRAAWALRTMLVYNANGVDYAQWYRLLGEHSGDDTISRTQFETMNLILDSLGNGQFIRINSVGYAFAQLHELGDYIYDSTLRDDSVYCYRFKKGSDYLYTIWGVESSPNIARWKDEKAIFHERKGEYKLPLQKGSRVVIRKPQKIGSSMSSQTMVVQARGLLIPYGLVPTFIQVVRLSLK